MSLNFSWKLPYWCIDLFTLVRNSIQEAHTLHMRAWWTCHAWVLEPSGHMPYWISCHSLPTLNSTCCNHKWGQNTPLQVITSHQLDTEMQKVWEFLLHTWFWPSEGRNCPMKTKINMEQEFDIQVPAPSDKTIDPVLFSAISRNPSADKTGQMHGQTGGIHPTPSHPHPIHLGRAGVQ